MAVSGPPQLILPPVTHQPLINTQDGIQRFSQPWTEHNQQVADLLNKIAAGGFQQGVTDGSEANPGAIGENMTASASGVGLTDNVAATICSLSLTAGDWDVNGWVDFSVGSGLKVLFASGIDELDSQVQATFPNGAVEVKLPTATKRYNITAAVTASLIALVSTQAPATASGVIRARRMR